VVVDPISDLEETVDDLRLEKISPANVGSACDIALLPGQERYVAPVARSLAEAYADPEHAWPRLIYSGERLVGFVMGGFRPGDPLLSSTLWRLNIAGDAQRSGCGRFAVQAVAAEARRRGNEVLSTAYVAGPQSPLDFYLRLGFRPTGRSLHNQFELTAEVDHLLHSRT
jgi:diamine N-acetyltransferase